MLTLFPSTVRAPEVPYVSIYRDHADPQQFYVLPDRPRIARDDEGNPLFAFVLFSRDIDIAFASAGDEGLVESQLGQVNLTIDIGLTQDELDKIIAYLTVLLEDERSNGSDYTRVFGVSTTGTIPKIDFPGPWLEGTINFDLLEDLGDTFKRASSNEVPANLTGSLSTPLWASLGAEGAQLLFKALTDEPVPGVPSPFMANVRYDLKGVARIPALQIDVSANGETLYKELRDRTTVTETSGGKKWTYPQVSELVKRLTEESLIEINDDEWNLPGVSEEVNNQIRSTIMSTVINLIIDRFFAATAAPAVLKEGDLGETFTHSREGGGVKGSTLWLRKFEESYAPSIEFHYKRNTNIPFPAAMGTSLLVDFTPEQLKRLVRVVDVGSPEVRWMEVHVTTNADFEADKVHRINVQLEYDHEDSLTNERLQRTQAYTFETGNETFTFRTRLARTPSGALIDTYNAKAQIIYRGIAAAPPPLSYTDISDRALTFSYDRLGYLKVSIIAGDVDWGEIDAVYVDLVYDAAAGQPDASKEVKLTSTVSKAEWTANKHGKSSNSYRYTVRYVFSDSREVTMQPRRSDRGSLVIHDDLAGKLQRTFEVVMDKHVENVIVRVRYEDPSSGTGPVESRQVVTKTGTIDWSHRVAEAAPRDVSYSTTIQFTDGLISTSDWKVVGPDDNTPQIVARRFPLKLRVDGGGLDWDKWRIVYVTLRYTGDHGYLVEEELEIDSSNKRPHLEVQAFAADARSYTYSATFVPKGDGDLVEYPGNGEMAVNTGFLLLERLLEDDDNA